MSSPVHSLSLSPSPLSPPPSQRAPTPNSGRSSLSSGSDTPTHTTSNIHSRVPARDSCPNAAVVPSLDSSPTAAIVDLLSTVSSTSTKITNFIRAVRSSHADLAAITRELADLSLLLELLRDESRIPIQIHGHLTAVTQACAEILHHVDQLLTQPPRDQDALPEVSQARWTTGHQAAARGLRADVQMYRDAHALVLPLINLILTSPDIANQPSPHDANEVLQQRLPHVLNEASRLQQLAVVGTQGSTAHSHGALRPYLEHVVAYANTTAGSASPIKGAMNCVSEKEVVDGASLPSGYLADIDMRMRRIPSTTDLPEPIAYLAGALADAKIVPIDKKQDPALVSHADSLSLMEACGPWFPPDHTSVSYYDQLRLFPGVLTKPLPQIPNSKHSGPPHLVPLRQDAHQPGNLPHIASQQDPISMAQSRQSWSFALPVYSRNPTSPATLPDATSPTIATSASKPDALRGSFSTQTSSLVDHTSNVASQRTSFSPPPLLQQFHNSAAITASAVPKNSPTHPTPSSPRLPPSLPSPAPLMSPRPSYATKANAFMDKLPSFRSKRRSARSSTGLSPSDDSRASVSTRSSSINNDTMSGLQVVPTMATSSRPPSTPAPSYSAATVSPTISSLPQVVTAEDIPQNFAPRGRPSTGKSIQVSLDTRLSAPPKAQGIFHLDISPSCTTVASKHANNCINIWSMTSGTVQSTIKFSSKVQAQARSRLYFVHSHAILSEIGTLIVIATSFGHTLEIWDWCRRKKVQVIQGAYRWASIRGDVYEQNWSPLAAYREADDRIDLFSVVRDPHVKKPFLETRRIELRQAGLPTLPKCPELAYSTTSPILVAACGPRPRAPPDEQSTLLTAWQLDLGAHPSGPGAHAPFLYKMPEHPELEGALPACLATYGSVAVSIWLPANYRFVRTATGEDKKVPVVVTSRFVLVWDLSSNTTRILPIPNCQACVSPDCRYVAYCDVAVRPFRFVVLDALDGGEVWSYPSHLSVRQTSWQPRIPQLDDLTRITNFEFSNDGNCLMIGDQEGDVGVYNVTENDWESNDGAGGTGGGLHIDSFPKP